MSRKSITVHIDECEITTIIRRIKKKEFKSLVSKLAGKGDALLKFFDKKGEEFVSKLPGIIEENIDFFCDEVILPYTNLTPEQLDEMDVVEIAVLLHELLELNNVKVDKVINFLKPDAAGKQKIIETMNFNGISIPSQN